MSRYRPTKKQLTPIRQYLEREFPGQVRHAWWDRDAQAQVFEVHHERERHHVVVDAGFLQACPDYVAGLRESELADYMREANAQARRFHVLEDGYSVRVRSTPLRSP